MKTPVFWLDFGDEGFPPNGEPSVHGNRQKSCWNVLGMKHGNEKIPESSAFEWENHQTMYINERFETIMPCFWYRILSIPEIQFHSSCRTSLDAMWHEAHLEASCMRVASERAGHTCSHESFIYIYTCGAFQQALHDSHFVACMLAHIWIDATRLYSCMAQRGIFLRDTHVACMGPW